MMMIEVTAAHLLNVVLRHSGMNPAISACYLCELLHSSQRSLRSADASLLHTCNTSSAMQQLSQSWKYFPLHEAPSLSCPSVLTEIFSYSAVVQPLQLYCGLWPVFVSLYVFKSNSLLPKRCTSVIRLLLLTDQTCIHH